MLSEALARNKTPDLEFVAFRGQDFLHSMIDCNGNEIRQRI